MTGPDRDVTLIEHLTRRAHEDDDITWPTWNVTATDADEGAGE